MERQIINIGKQLRLLRKEAGFRSYADFAWTNDINKTQYGRMEKGINCTINSLIIVLTIHDLTLQQFFNSFSELEPISTQTTP
jgi:hypothetical protein